MKLQWFAVHVVMVIQVRRPRAFVPVFENVFLVQARGWKEAERKGARFGKREEHSDGLTWGGVPSKLVFRGVRKVIACAPDTSRSGEAIVRVPHDCMEATYSRFTVKNSEQSQLRRVTRNAFIVDLNDDFAPRALGGELLLGLGDVDHRHDAVNDRCEAPGLCPACEQFEIGAA